MLIYIVPNGCFELDSAALATTYSTYMFPTSWTGAIVSGGGSVVIRYGSNNWKHATNANDPGTFFLGIQHVSNYVEQTIAVPQNTYFAVQFDVSARQLFAVATLQVYCNAAGNTGTTLLPLLVHQQILLLKLLL
jgi:hypothetical protein